MSAAGEDRLLAWLRRQAGVGARLLGDDAALLDERRAWAVTVDSQIEGVHFPTGTAPTVVARRLLAVNLSDLAAVGARPRYAFLSLSAPAAFPHRSFLRALGAACREQGLTLAGGDLARHPVPTFTLALLGARPPGGRWLRRDAGRAGDRLFVGGTLGESALGRHLLERGAHLEGERLRLPRRLPRDRRSRDAARAAIERHLSPRPQLELGERLGRRRRCACIDLSDGLALDLGRLCAASGVGAVVEAEALPVPAAAALTRRLGLEPLELALAGGEDYVLLFALPAGTRPPRGCGATPIGRLTAQRRLRLDRDGQLRPLAPRGWDHLAGG